MQIQAFIQLATEILLIRHTSPDYHSDNFDCKMVTWMPDLKFMWLKQACSKVMPLALKRLDASQLTTHSYPHRPLSVKTIMARTKYCISVGLIIPIADLSCFPTIEKRST